MKKMLIFTFLFITIKLFAQIGTGIPISRLPTLEPWWFDDTIDVIPWQNAGCLRELTEYGGLEIHEFININTDLSSIAGNSLTEKLNNILRDSLLYFPNKNILLYFPSGYYEIDSLDIKRNNVVIKGESGEDTEIHFTKEMLISIADDGHGTYIGRQRYDLIRVNNRSNIGLEDLKFTVENQTTVFDVPISETGYNGMFVKFLNSENCWISGCKFLDAPRHAVYIWQSHNIEIRGSYFNDAWSHGGGGNGYGIQLFGPLTHHCLIENNIFRHFRHAIVFIEECKYNVIGYNYIREAYEFEFLGMINYTLGQLCFHGAQGYLSNTGPEYNLCEGNICSFIHADDSHDSNGPYNTIFRNRANYLGIWIDHLTDSQNIANNYFKAEDIDDTIAGYPWIVHGSDHLTLNNLCKDYWDVQSGDNGSWETMQYSTLWQDYSYYHDSRPDFFTNNFNWPFDPRYDENPARYRWEWSTNTVLTGWDHINILDSSHDDSDAYFYSYYDPVNDETNKELTFYYFTYKNNEDDIYVTIEQDNSYLGDWNHKSVHLGGSHGYIPARTAAERIVLPSSSSTSDFTITIDNSENDDIVMNVSYDYDGFPPLPIMLTDGDDSIYPEKNGVYTPNLTFGYQYFLCFNAPNSAGFTINDGDNYSIRLEDTYTTSYNLVDLGYVSFGSSDAQITIPSQTKVFGTGTNEWGLTAPIDIVVSPIYPQDYFFSFYSFWNSNENFFEGMMCDTCWIQTMLFPVTSSGGGSSCPTLYFNKKEVNNILSLAENKTDDVIDYLLFDGNIDNENEILLSLKENEQYVNYIDQITITPISHSDNVEIGVTTQGNIFSYISDESFRVDLRTDSTLILLSTDTLFVPIDDYNFPTNEVYIQITSRLCDSRATAGEKDATDIGEKVRSDSIYCFDVVGNHENLYTSYSQIPVTLVQSGVGDVVIMPRNDIEIHEISFIYTDMRSNEFYQIEECEIMSATTENYSPEDTFQKLLYPDENYIVFGQNEGIDLKLRIDGNLNSKTDFIARVKGRYISKELYEDIPPKVSFNSYPNPFNPTSTISFSINKHSHINLSVYNIKGQKVTTLLDQDYSPGDYQVSWMGKDCNDIPVSSGVYFYKLKSGENELIQKTLLLK